MAMFMVTYIFYISYVEPLFVVATITGSPGKNVSLLQWFSNFFPYDVFGKVC